MDITSQFEIIDPLNRNVVRIDDDSVIENDFFSYRFENYSIRPDQIIDFGTGPNQESLVFTAFQGDDWMDARRSHYFEVCYWRDTQSFEDMIGGASWFSAYHYGRSNRYEKYFYTSAGYPAYLIISWLENEKKVGFQDYYYSLLIDATTLGHSSESSTLKAGQTQPWLQISMQSMVGLGSNQSAEENIDVISEFVYEITSKIEIKQGKASPKLNLENFNKYSANSSPFSFIDGVDLGNGWYYSDWFGSFYKSSPGWIYQPNLGWLRYENSTSISSWCWHPLLNWFWISKSSYPHIYLEHTSWSYLSTSNGKLIAYDYINQAWYDLESLVPSKDDSFPQRIFKIARSFDSESTKKKKIAKYILFGK